MRSLYHKNKYVASRESEMFTHSMTLFGASTNVSSERGKSASVVAPDKMR